MSIKPFHGEEIIIEGNFSFIANFKDFQSVEDNYNLRLVISEDFPYVLPKVYELEGKIPKDHTHHVNPDGTLCLGSPLRLLLKISDNPTINTFVENCLVPFLYSISYKLRNGGPFVFGELEHGIEGVLDDYLEIFDLSSLEQVLNVLFLLGMSEKAAYKQPCPCNCGNKLRKCEFRFKVDNFRKVASRAFYKNQYTVFKKINS